MNTSSAIPTAARGCVYIVGAGPGDPGLMTLRAAELLRQATIVYFDRLLEKEILCLAPRGIPLVDVGKESTAGGQSQQRINERIVQSAREGHVVVRLKGGDPFVFGRGGEEALACAEAGVPFEVVPGVTSAIAAAAYAGIPVTHRGYSSTFTVITGQGAEGSEPDVDWEAFARAGGTLVILMGVGRLETLCRRLIDGGRAPQTPAALVRHGTRPDQQTLVSTLDRIAEEAQRAGFRSPAAFIVSNCVALRETLSWVEKRPLFGLRVAVTRPEGEAEELNALLRAAGAGVVHCPTIRIEPRPVTTQATEIVASLSSFQWLVLTSVNGVRCFFDLLASQGRDARALGGLRVAAIGAKTAEALKAHGIQADRVPSEFTQEGVLKAIGDVQGDRILLARASVARDVLPDTLRARGARLEILPLYDTRPDTVGIERLKELLAAGELDLATFTSASTVQMLLAAIPEAGQAALFTRCRTASIGPATSAALRDAGLRVDIEAMTYTANGLFEAILRDRSGEAS